MLFRKKPASYENLGFGRGETSPLLALSTKLLLQPVHVPQMKAAFLYPVI